MREQFIIVHHNILSSGLSTTAIAVYLHLSATDKLDIHKIISQLNITYEEFDEAMCSLGANRWFTQDLDGTMTINVNPFN